MKVYSPPWAKPGCKVVEEWTEVIQSGAAIGDSTFCKFKNARGKIETTMKWVKWRDPKGDDNELS